MSGIRNQTVATSTRIVAPTRPTTRPGSTFPIRISTGRSGVTSSWSKVPSSRSRASERAVTRVDRIRVMVPTSPGMKNHRLSRFGLNQLRTSMRAGIPP